MHWHLYKTDEFTKWAKKNLDKQEYELRTIVKQFLIQGKKFKSLDLRFNKPVVKF